MKAHWDRTSEVSYFDEHGLFSHKSNLLSLEVRSKNVDNEVADEPLESVFFRVIRDPAPKVS